MLRQFQVSSELQQFLSGLDTAALDNVTFNIFFPGDAPLLPMNPSGIRRSLMFSRVEDDGMATPAPIYNCWLANLDYSSEQRVTYSRGS